MTKRTLKVGLIPVALTFACTPSSPAPAMVRDASSTLREDRPAQPAAKPASPPVAVDGGPLGRLRLAYFPDEPDRPTQPGVGRPAGSTRIAHQGRGCPNPALEERCGVFWLGKAGDTQPVDVSCSEKALTSPPAAAQALVGQMRTAILGSDKLKHESLAEVATLDVDGDGHMDRLLSASFEVVPTPENVNAYDQAPRCRALLIDTGAAVIPVSEDACKAPGTSERLLQAFKVVGLPGLVLQIARAGGESQGAFLVHVVGGRSTPLALPPCDGNG